MSSLSPKLLVILISAITDPSSFAECSLSSNGNYYDPGAPVRYSSDGSDPFPRGRRGFREWPEPGNSTVANQTNALIELLRSLYDLSTWPYNPAYRPSAQEDRRRLRDHHVRT